MAKLPAAKVIREVFVGVGISIGILVPVAIVGPVFFSVNGKNLRLVVLWRVQNSVWTRGSKALDAGDVVHAKAYADAVLRFAPTHERANLLLADALQCEGESRKAMSRYDRWLVPKLTRTVNQRELLLFGDAAQAVGRPDDARVAYREVIKLNASSFDTEVVGPILSPQAKLSDVKLIANTMSMVGNQQKGYAGALQRALQQVPNDPCLHYMRASILANSGRLREAKAEVALSASELPPEAATRLLASAAAKFRFYRLDPGYQAVAGTKAN